MADININNEVELTIKEKILEQLEQVIDPELGIDIVNLGLVYEVDLSEEGICEVKMTLTTIGCPLAGVIMEEVQNELLKIEEIQNVNVELVWYPAWTPERMSRYARIALGVRL